MGLYQIKRLMFIKRNNYQNKDIAYRMRENLCQLFIGQGINIQDMYELKKLNTERTNKTGCSGSFL
jgi:ribosome biogenesis GTPase A